jgi:hypothetical protein
MHSSAHAEDQRFPQKLKRRIAIVWGVIFLSNTGLLSVTSALRDERGPCFSALVNHDDGDAGDQSGNIILQIGQNCQGIARHCCILWSVVLMWHRFMAP